MGQSRFSRRDFLKTMVIGGVTVYIAAPFSFAHAALFNNGILEPASWDKKDHRIRHRLDAFAKVTGEKVFAFDIRAKDMPNWPEQQAYAFVLRVTEADKKYEGFDLSLLEKNQLLPDKVVTAEILEADSVKLPSFFGDDLLLPKGKTPGYLGQAVALFIYNDFARYRFAKEMLQFREDIIQYGEYTGFLERDPWSTYRGVRIGGNDPFDPDVYSAMEYSAISKEGYRKYIPFWPEANKGGNMDERGMYYAEHLASEFKNPPEDWLILDREIFSQSIDASAMEPCSSNGWYDAKTSSLHFVVADQSVMDVKKHIIQLVTSSKYPLKNFYLHPCSTVGYGTKGGAIEPMFGVVATLYSHLPVRFANNRYEQFQSGIKRHAFNMRYQLAVDKKNGKIASFIGHFTANGGGRCNYTPGVVAVGATGVQGIYYIPKSDIIAEGIASRAVDAGSVRGFGTLQSMTAFDSLLDEAAKILDQDPVQFRLNNLMSAGMKNTQGAIPAGDMRGGEVLKACSEHTLWKDRRERKLRYETDNPGKILATGISCAQKDFGTGNESSFVKIEISPEGKISLWHSGLEIGSGMETSQTVLCAKWFGVPAHHSYFAMTDWPDLPMNTKDHHDLTQEKQNELSKNPLWTPAYSSSTGASNSAYYFSHVTSEAGRVLFDYGIWPAALSIWSEGIGGGQADPLTVRREDARWTDAGLTADGLEPLSLERIVKRLYEIKGLTGVVAHGYNRWQWAVADFKILKETVSLPLDGLSLKWADDTKYHINERLFVRYPAVQRNNAAVTNYTAVAIAVELSIDRATGETTVLDHHSVLECGNMIVPELVSGQMQGGIAMGIGHALYEYLPLYEDGPGNGTWNFNRYHLPLASEVAVWKQTQEVLPPLSDTDPPKGMAEVAMIPVVSAITNAIADATGHYFYHHPIRPNEVLEVLNANNQ